MFMIEKNRDERPHIFFKLDASGFPLSRE